MRIYQNIEVNGCRSCTRKDHQHWEEQPEREREGYRSQDPCGRPSRKRLEAVDAAKRRFGQAA
jgi:hypothetical protein